MKPSKVVALSALTTVVGAYLFERLGIRVKGF